MGIALHTENDKYLVQTFSLKHVCEHLVGAKRRSCGCNSAKLALTASRLMIFSLLFFCIFSCEMLLYIELHIYMKCSVKMLHVLLCASSWSCQTGTPQRLHPSFRAFKSSSDSQTRALYYLFIWKAALQLWKVHECGVCVHVFLGGWCLTEGSANQIFLPNWILFYIGAIKSSC